MRHVVATVLVASLGLAAAAYSAEDVKPNANPPTPPPPTAAPAPLTTGAPAPVAAERSEKWEPGDTWIAAIERLRTFPKPGEVANAGVKAGVTDIVKVSEGEAANVDKIVTEYDSAALQLSAKWEQDLKTLRTEYEAKIIAALPEARRDTAKKLLELSHAKWVTPTERDVKFKKEFIEREKAFKLETKNKSPEEAAEARDEIKAWIREERAKMAKEDEDTVNALKALLTPEEAANLERFNRHRVVQPPPTAPAPQPQPKK
jgi:hypothetical protein